MNLELLKKLKGGVFSNYGVAILVVIFLLTVGRAVLQENKTPNLNINRNDSVASGNLIPQGPVLSKSLPVNLRIPKISIDATFVEPLGLEVNGEVSVPNTYTQVGWYKFGPTPGELGPSVILGHVDSHTGPAIFFYLGQLVEGDDIYVDREDGSEAHFKVEKLERYKQAEFPTQLVYGNIDHAGLRLITCTGIYVKGSQRYTHNLVVYAKLVE